MGIFFHDSNARSIIGLFPFITPRLGFSLSVYLAPFSSIFGVTLTVLLLVQFTATVRHRGMETGISEASKRVSIFSFATQTPREASK